MNEKKKLHYGWFIVISCVLIMALEYAPLVSCASLFVTPITSDLGFPRSAYMLVSSISTIVMILLAPFVGKIMSKPCMHKVLVFSVAGVSISYGLYSVANSLPVFYIIAVFIGIFASGSTMLPVSIVITNLFQKKRGFAMSLAMAGSGIGGALLSPVIAKMITDFGWRKTYVILAVIIFVVLVPVTAIIIRQKPADKGMQPYGFGEAAEASKKSAPEKEWNVSLKDLRKMPLFWAFVVGLALISVTGSVISHIPSAITDAGYSATKAASIVSLYLAIAVPGKLVLGHVFDKYGAKKGIIFGNVLFTLSVVALLFIDKEAMLYVMAVLFGFGTCIGTVSGSVLTSKLFGTAHYAEIFGFVSVFTNAGFAVGVPLIATVYDVTKSYHAAWIIIIALSELMTALLLFSAKKSEEHTK